MGYRYGTQGAPVAGTAAPGLPQRQTTLNGDTSGPPVQVLTIRATTNYVTPDWATFARVTALGKGGQGLGGTVGPAIGSTGAHGGGGGGLAATNIESVSSGTPVSINLDSGSALAAFLNYQLSGGKGGDATQAAGGAGGAASGGAVNFAGGAGYTCTNGSAYSAPGGGAAGRAGAGNAATSSNPGDGGLGDAYTTGGGAGGALNQTSNGQGAGAYCRLDGSLLGAAVLGKSTRPFGTTTALNCDGGDGGGGSGGSQPSNVSNIPGAGLVLIELW